jgi:hypothetical protein
VGNFNKAMDIVNKAGITEGQILNTSKEKITKFLEIKE